MIYLANISFMAIILFSLTKNEQEKVKTGVIWSSILISGVAFIEVVLQFFYPVEAIIQVWFEHLNPFFLGEGLASSVRDYPSLLVNILGQTYLRATAFFPDPHTLSLYIGTTLPLLFVWQKEKGFFHKGLFIVSCFAFLFTFSRGAYVALVIVALLAGIIFVREKLRVFWKEGVVLVFGICFIVLFTPVGSRLLSSWSMEDGSRMERVRLLEEAIQHIQEKPFLGVGIGNYPVFVNPSATDREPIYVHNLYLDIAVEQGLVGLALFLAFISTSLTQSYWQWQKYQNPYQAATFLGVAYFLAHSFFEAPIYSYHVMAVTLFLISYYSREKKHD